MKETEVEFVDYWFYTLDNFDKLVGVWPVCIGNNIAKANYKNGPRQIPFYNLHFVLEGKVQLFFSGQQVILQQGDVFCKFPNTIYSYQIVPSETPLRVAWVSFDGHQSHHILSMAGFEVDKPYRRKIIDKDFEILLKQLFMWCKGNSRKQLMTMRSLMYRIFSKLLPDKDQEVAYLPCDWVRKSMEFIQAYYSEKITVEDVAKYVGLHRTYLSKIFSKEVGIPPSNYLIKTRLDRAKQFLLESSLTVTEIALSVGYPDIYSFTRAFTRHFGISPSVFKQQSNL